MAWCKDTARDAAVRAAEDGRTGPLPTLGECIVAPFAEAAERSVEVSKTGEGQSGMRTERITLEVTHKAALSAREWHMWRTIFDPRYGESVRVVEEPHFDDLAQVAMQRDAAIREREAWKLLADRTNERLSAAEARVAELEQQIGQADAEDADTGYALRLFVDGRRILSHELGPTQAGAFLIAADHLAKYIREEYKPITDATNSSVSDLEAASGGGEQPRGWLTSEEKAAIRWAMSEGFDEEVLCGLLSRSSPPEVVLESWREAAGEVVSLDDVRAALAAIGVAVKEVGK